MGPLRIRATQLESFRLYLTEDWMEEPSLLASLTGEFTPTPAVRLGHAYHAVLEHPEQYRASRGYVCEGYQFDDATMAPMLDLIDRRGVFEVKATKAFGPVTLVAQADQLVGAHLYEFKTTSHTFDPDKYLQSVQWRVMAAVFEPSAITYRVAQLDDHGNGVAELKALDSVTAYPYPNLERDLRDLVDRFVAYVQQRQLEPYLRQSHRAEDLAA